MLGLQIKGDHDLIPLFFQVYSLKPSQFAELPSNLLSCFYLKAGRINLLNEEH